MKTPVIVKASLSTPPPAPDAEIPFEPATEAIDLLARTGAGNVHRAREILLERHHDQIAKAKFCPSTWQATLEDLKADLALRRKISDTLATCAEAVGEVSQHLVQRGEARRELAILTATLADAKAMLAAPSALDLPPAEALHLDLQTKHLPGRITEVETRIAELTAAIDATVQAHQIDTEALKLSMRQAARRQDGQAYIADPHVHQLFESHFMD